MFPEDNTKQRREYKNYCALPYNPRLQEAARSLRKAGNLAEVVFWQQVKQGKLLGLDFDRQKIIGNFIVDFFCASNGVVIEIDGSSHDGREEHDANRDFYLNSLGLYVFHLRVGDVLNRIEKVMEQLRTHPALVREYHPVAKG